MRERPHLGVLLGVLLGSALTASTTRAEVEPGRHPVDPLLDCRALLLDDRAEDAERCLHDALAAPGIDEDSAARARALLDVAVAWRKHLAATAPTPPAATIAPAADAAAPAPPHEELSVGALLRDGTGEAVVQGALGGGTAAFLVAGTVASATRASEDDTLGYLVGAPAAGALVGAAGSYVTVRALSPSVGDLRLATASMWMGGVQGYALQLAVFDGSPDVGAIPLRFLTVLAGGAVGLGAGAALGPLLEVEDGDVGVANSAALWGGVLSAVVLLGTQNSGAALSTPGAVALIAGGIGVPWAAVLAAHELLDIDRWSSFLIDGGGAAGFLTAAAALAVLSGSMGGSAVLASSLMGAGVVAGVTVGTVAAVIASKALRPEAKVLARHGDTESEVE
ncbi:MAG: hypothetical protein IT382_20690 [Deltaproteobacteria bacterium]|nr:hypothetical protein [Deltaproteobacteria bacterium]